MPQFGSNQWLAVLVGLIPIALGYSLVILGKLGGTELMAYCQISVPVVVGIALGGSAVTKIFEPKPAAPQGPQA